MSWIAEYDTQGMEFPTCVHVTKTTGTMTHGATYVPIEEGKAVRVENAKLREQLDSIVGRSFRTADKMSCLEAENDKLRELVRDLEVAFIHGPCYRWCEFKEPCNGDRCQYRDRMRELGVEV